MNALIKSNLETSKIYEQISDIDEGSGDTEGNKSNSNIAAE